VTLWKPNQKTSNNEELKSNEEKEEKGKEIVSEVKETKEEKLKEVPSPTKKNKKHKKSKKTANSTENGSGVQSKENKEQTTKEEEHKPLMVNITFQVESSLQLSFEQALNEKGENMQQQFVKFMKDYIMSK